MKITIISDTHGKHELLTKNNLLVGGDVIIHCGDMSNMGKPDEITDFLNWYEKLPYTHKVFIAGNHDFWFEKNFTIPKKYNKNGVIYLFDKLVNIDGLNIYGSPWQPEFYNWAFNVKRGKELAEIWAKIPENLDILVTHGPPSGILDYTYTGMNVGCVDLSAKIMEVKPKISCFGHIHYGYGEKVVNGVQFFNAAVLGEQYTLENKPIDIEYDVNTKEITFV